MKALPPPSPFTATMGRPTTFSPEIAERICEEIITCTDGMEVICKRVGVPYSTFTGWLLKNKDFSGEYMRAKAAQMDLFIQKAFEIAATPIKDRDMAEAGRIKVEIDLIKWYASKLAPKLYGDKAVIEHEHKHSLQVTPEELTALMSKIEEVSIPLVSPKEEEDDGSEYIDYTDT